MRRVYNNNHNKDLTNVSTVNKNQICLHIKYVPSLNMYELHDSHKHIQRIVNFHILFSIFYWDIQATKCAVYGESNLMAWYTYLQTYLLTQNAYILQNLFKGDNNLDMSANVVLKFFLFFLFFLWLTINFSIKFYP